MLRKNIVLFPWLLFLLKYELCAQQKNEDGIYVDTLVMINDAAALRLNDEDADSEDISRENSRKDINRVGMDELLGIGLSIDQALSFMQYRRKSGGFKDIYELQAVPLLDELSIRKLRATVYVIPRHADIKELFRQIFHGTWQSSIRGDYELDQGSSPERGFSRAGNSDFMLPFRLRFKIKHSAAWVDWGITGEKDAGERLVWSNKQKGLDSYQGYMRFRGWTFIRQLILGDYKVSIGQGLLIRQRTVMGLLAESLHGLANSEVIIPHRGYDEVFFKRGVAMEMRWGDFGCVLFASKKQLDGVIREDSLTKQRFINTIYRSGLHTDSLLAERRNKISEKMSGFRISWNKAWGNLGISALCYDYGHAFTRSDRIYARYRDTNRIRAAGGFDYSLTYLGMHAFGESTGTVRGSVSMIHNLSIPVSGGLSLGLTYRNYDKAYDLPDAQVWGVRTEPQDEMGWLAQLRYQSGGRWEVMLFWDISGSKWLRYGRSGSQQMEHFVMMLSRHWGKQHTMRWMYRGEKTTEPALKNKACIDVRYEYKPRKGMDFRVRYLKNNYINSGIVSTAEYLGLGTDLQLKNGVNVKLRLFSLESDGGGVPVYEAIPDVAGFVRYIARYGREKGGSINLQTDWKGLALGFQYRFTFKENLKINPIIQNFSIYLIKRK